MSIRAALRFRGIKVASAVVVFAPLWMHCLRHLRDPRFPSWLLGGSLGEFLSRHRASELLDDYRDERRSRSLRPTAAWVRLAGRMLFFASVIVLMVFVSIPS